MDKKIVCSFLPTQLPTVQYFRFYNYTPSLITSDIIDFRYPTLDFNNKNSYWELEIDNNAKKLFDEVINPVTSNSKIVIVQRIISLGGLAVLDLFKQNNIKIITEIDDSMNIQPYQEAFKNYHEGSDLTQIFEEQLKMSDHIIVTTERLKQEYSKFNNNISIIPNCISSSESFIQGTSEKNTELKFKNNKIKILWVGSSSHDKDIRMVYKSLKEISEEYKDKVEIKLCGGISPELYNERDLIKKELWALPLNKYYNKLSSEGFDIGIAPLCENIFNYCKSNLRFLEYSVLNTMTICSDIYPFSADINNKVAIPAYYGYSGKPNWKEVIKHVLDTMSKEDIHNFGSKANEYCSKTYNASEIGTKYKKIVEQIL